MTEDPEAQPDGKDSIANDDDAKERKSCKLPKTSLLFKCLIAIGIITIITVAALAIKGVFKGPKYSTSANGACGTKSNGGINEQVACCMEQTSFCQTMCKLDLDPNKCLVTCTKNRGCDPQTYLSCIDFGTFSAGSSNKCGSEGQGGTTCKSDCCPAQKVYCRDMCSVDLNPNGCLMTCLDERGCDFESTGLTCEDFGTFSAGEGNKCGSEGQGGTTCKSDCCPAQKDYCRSMCSVDLNPNGCLMTCLDERGCDFESTGLTCEDFGTFSAGEGNQCGGVGQGGMTCKSVCCPFQNGYCVNACALDIFNYDGCLTQCNADRGC